MKTNYTLGLLTAILSTMIMMWGATAMAGSPLEIPKPPKANMVEGQLSDPNRELNEVSRHLLPLVNLRVHNGMFLAAEQGGGGKIVANRKEAREWETFAIEDLNEGSLMSGDAIHLKTFTRHFYVSASNNGVNASKSQPTQAETFTIVKLRGSGPILFGDKIALMTTQKRYMVAEGGGGKMVNANRTEADIWETFTLVRSEFQHVSVQGTWKDTHGNQYNFGQKDSNFWWRAPALKLYGKGTINGDTIQNEIYSETNHELKGTVNGTLTTIQLDGSARHIEWSDGMVFTK